MVQKHKKPLDQSPSEFLVKSLDKFCHSTDFRFALDLPCGFGRHSLYLFQKKYKVVCADYDPDVFTNRWFNTNSELMPIRLNAKTKLPFKSESFGLIVIFHFYSGELFTTIGSILKKGGVVIFESFGGQGNNWKELPNKENFNERLEEIFEILYIKKMWSVQKKII